MISNFLKRSIAVLATGLALTQAATAASSSAVGPSISSESMQCYALYSMLMSDGEADDFRNKVLGSQAYLMGTIYSLYAGSPEHPIDKARFSNAERVARAGLISTARQNRQPIVQKLIDCEGWREELLTDMVLATRGQVSAGNEESMREALMEIPEPQPSYPLKGVSRSELNLLVDEAFKQYLQ